MKLSEGIKQSGRPFYIPDCPRSTLPEFFTEMGFKVGAEIGVYKGKFCEKFCLAGIKMYAVDHWLAEDPINQARQDYLFRYTKAVLRRAGNCEIIKKSSMEAVKQFAPESLDFVYIDADHSFNAVYNDLKEWYKVVKKGGILAGHDYAYTGTDARALQAFNNTCGIKKAVDIFLSEADIENFYTFGRSKPEEEESKNDRYLSFMFSKP